MGLLADMHRLNSPLKRLIYQLILIVIFLIINELFIRSIRIPVFDILLSYNFFFINFHKFLFFNFNQWIKFY